MICSQSLRPRRQLQKTWPLRCFVTQNPARFVTSLPLSGMFREESRALVRKQHNRAPRKISFGSPAVFETRGFPHFLGEAWLYREVVLCGFTIINYHQPLTCQQRSTISPAAVPLLNRGSPHWAAVAGQSPVFSARPGYWAVTAVPED